MNRKIRQNLSLLLLMQLPSVMLQLPPTIREPTENEMDYRPDKELWLEKRHRMVLEAGYTVEANKTRQLPFSHIIHVNADNSKIQAILLSLLGLFPEQVHVSYGRTVVEPKITDLLPVKLLSSLFRRYGSFITQDAELFFMVSVHNSHELIEMELSALKYIRYWGSAVAGFEKVMQEFQIPARKTLLLLDEFPHIITPIERVVSRALSTNDLLREMDRFFEPYLEY